MLYNRSLTINLSLALHFAGFCFLYVFLGVLGVSLVKKDPIMEKDLATNMTYHWWQPKHVDSGFSIIRAERTSDKAHGHSDQPQEDPDSDKENIDPNTPAARISAEQATLDKEIFGGSSDLSRSPPASPCYVPQSPDPYAVLQSSPSHPDNKIEYWDDPQCKESWGQWFSGSELEGEEEDDDLLHPNELYKQLDKWRFDNPM